MTSRPSQEMGSQSPEIVEPKQDKHLLDKVVVWLGLSVFFRFHLQSGRMGVFMLCSFCFLKQAPETKYLQSVFTGNCVSEA